MIARSGVYRQRGRTFRRVPFIYGAAAPNAYTLTADAAGSYALAGKDATLTVDVLTDYTLTADAAGAYALTGLPVTIIYSGLVTPDDRIYVVAAEGRVYIVAAESRTHTVAAQGRVYTAA